MSFYTSLSGSRRRTGRSSASRTARAGSSQRALAQSAKLEQAQELRDALNEFLNLHRQDFPEAVRPIAPAPPPIHTKAIISAHRAQAVKGIGLFQRAARKAALAAADQAAQREIERQTLNQEQQRVRYQAQLDQWWAALVGNDEDVVLSVLAEAFEDNEAPAAAVGVNGSELSVVVLVPSIDIVPERRPATTPAGNLTLKKLAKAERGGLHTTMVASHVLLTVREALAVAPGITGVRVVALQHSRNDAFGRPRVDVLLAANFERTRLAAVRWDQAEAGTIVDDAATECPTKLRRTTNELQALDLSHESAIEELLAHVELDELISRQS
ncbi:MAG TPA: hypothetical protein VFV67_19010 [Actinophytocola sp.]|uniref:hypothetical protein n=1 Tax=Actinophytocola sp. TaxID=1872138 RepID=UPI002DBCB97D|nr:hypothetical protein [Actinophytocola sp.]HEU5472743.1 hypothetical protein [Actinophytocola sp.]